MDFSALPVAALPLSTPETASAPATGCAPELRQQRPLAQRLTLNPTITAKVNYFDLAQTRRAPFDLRTSLIWLCLCAHDNAAWWEPRTADHRDGEDAPPLPLALNFAAWMRYIQDWQCRSFAVHEDHEIEVLALRSWIAAHETVCVPEEDSKKNGPARHPTGPSFTPTLSAAATPPGATTSSSGCPCAPFTASCTPGFPPMACPASAPPSPTAATPKSAGCWPLP